MDPELWMLQAFPGYFKNQWDPFLNSLNSYSQVSGSFAIRRRWIKEAHPNDTVGPWWGQKGSGGYCVYIYLLEGAKLLPQETTFSVYSDVPGL